tara:strand:+ start:7702 stop:7893 length:192 start_codon:yes stop_codon:yes gene_type:complete
MKQEILDYFAEKPILSAKNISRHLNVKRKQVSGILNNNSEFRRTTYWDTGCGKFHTNTFTLSN